MCNPLKNGKKVKQRSFHWFNRLILNQKKTVTWKCVVPHHPGGGGGDTPFDGVYRHVQHQRVCFFSRFEIEYHFDHFGVKYGMICAL